MDDFYKYNIIKQKKEKYNIFFELYNENNKLQRKNIIMYTFEINKKKIIILNKNFGSLL